MYTIDNNTVFNNGKKIISFDNPEDAEHFVNAAQEVINKKEETKLESRNIITTISEFKKYLNINK